MTESSENLLNHILVKNPGMPREELLSMVERKKQESHGLLSEEGAVRLLAQQLAGLSGQSVNISDLRISSVQAGLSDATISGEILSLSQLREFQRSDGSIRKLQRSRGENGPAWALCENEEGLTMAKFWDDNMETVLSMGEGSVITIKNPWITERNGMVYLNVGSKSSITKETLVDIESPPPVTIASIKPGPKLYTTRGVVVERTDPREIETREGRRTRVSNIRVEDGTGKIRIALWDNHAQIVESLRMGDAIRLTGIKARESSNGELEASTVFLTQIEKS